MNRDSLFLGQPNQRFYTKPNHEGIILTIEERRVTLEVFACDLQNTYPAGNLGYVTDKLVTRPDLARGILLAWSEPRDALI